ncbi:MAG: cyclase family protein [Actinobacteria bacterium]|nr:cyclase family protein [Actinomycetota bacterium]
MSAGSETRGPWSWMSGARVYDVTAPLRPDMPTWDDEPGPRLEWQARLADGRDHDLSSFSMGSHSGTHVDAPAHYVRDGGTVERLPVGALLGPAVVVEHTGDADITAADLAALGVDGTTRRVLFKTGNGRLWDDPTFRRDYVALAASAALSVVELGLELVGIDYLSIEAYDSPGFAVHHALLEAGVVVLEGVDLRRVPAGKYLLVCAPLKLVGAEGAPARVFLIGS